MRLPDGSILMHDAVHAYDPVKAHEYYIKNRKLLGRKPAGRQQLLSVPATVATAPKPKPKAVPVASPEAKAAAWKKFLEALPMAVEGADLKTTDAFVKSFQGKSDSELKAAAAKIKKERGDNDGAQVATINALLTARSKAKAAKPTTPPAKGLPAKPAPAKGLPAKGAPAAAKPAAPKLSPKELAVQKQAATKRVSNIKAELADLNDRLKEKMAAAKEAEAKAKQGPTAADKAQSARDSKKYRDKNAQKIANKAKKAASSAKASDKSKTDTVESLKKDISEAKGRLTAAVAKLRSLSAAK